MIAKRIYASMLIGWMLFLTQTPKAQALHPMDSAFMYMDSIMDFYHDSLDIYTEFVSGGNHYSWPCSFSAPGQTIQVNHQWTDAPANGCTCMRLKVNSVTAWSGTGWYDLDTCDSMLAPGYDLNLGGANSLSFYARSDEQGMKIQFEVIDCPSTQTLLTLGTSWARFTIPITGCPSYPVPMIFSVVYGCDSCTHACIDCAVYFDDIVIDYPRLDSLRFIKSYIEKCDTDTTDKDLYWAINQAYTYDNAMAMLAYLSRCDTQSLRRARMLGDAFVYAQTHDRRFHDGRLRNAYSTGEISRRNIVRLPGSLDGPNDLSWNEDEYQMGTYTGEMAWVILAWLNYRELTGDTRYDSSAIRLGQWIRDSTYDSLRQPYGYMGGYLGFGPQPLDTLPKKEHWKSTEHNIDVYVAFKKLYLATGNPNWMDWANDAWDFVDSMWSGTHFVAGTTDSGQVNLFAPLDAQPWALLARPDTASAYDTCLTWARANCFFDSTYTGFGFSSQQDTLRGIWWEGTAQMVAAYRLRADSNRVDTFLTQLRNWRVNAPPLVGDGKGIVAAFPEAIYTGITRSFGLWNYYQRLHLGATAWYIFAENNSNYNPYWLHSPIPEPIFSYADTELVVTFSGVVASGGAAALQWDFGDGDTSLVPNPTHTYTAPGTYTVCLTASAACGSDTVCHPVTVTCPPPQPGFTFSVTSDTFHFTNTTPTPHPTTYQWWFGDGFGSTAVSPSHIYQAPGTYQVCLVATNVCGSDTFCTLVVGVNESAKGTGIKLFPNPTSGLIHLELDIPAAMDVKLVLINPLGQELACLVLPNASNETHRWDVTNVADGIYLLRIETEQARWQDKVVIMKE